MSNKNNKTLRLILGDQLNSNHSWFKEIDDSVTYLMMECRSETDYTMHHIQKVVGFFAAMQAFANELIHGKHKVIYLKINDLQNLQVFDKNLTYLIKKHKFTNFEYQNPDEYRLDELLRNFCTSLAITFNNVDSEHFLSTRGELGAFFFGKKIYLMESFYRMMRKKHNILMDGKEPTGGQWNFDADNRKKLPANHKPTAPLVFENNVKDILHEINKSGAKTFGNIDPDNFVWPINRSQSLQLLDFFVQECLPLFGTYEDAMSINEWSIYHSRLSFSMNTKMLSPLEVIKKAVEAWEKSPKIITINQVEGFVRQILGWREYMWGIYFLKMPDFAQLNYFNNEAKLPAWYWTGKTKMNCLKHSIGQSLQFAYAHHIQRLMITGNFALLAGVHPDEVDSWYLGIYIDALEWVEITNTRGMSQFADGGIIGSKPYVSSASYINKMSNYCGSCYYDKDKKVGDKACPFNSLYWNFYDRNASLLAKNPRIGMMYNIWNKMLPDAKAEILAQAQHYLKNIDDL